MGLLILLSDCINLETLSKNITLGIQSLSQEVCCELTQFEDLTFSGVCCFKTFSWLAMLDELAAITRLST